MTNTTNTTNTAITLPSVQYRKKASIFIASFIVVTGVCVYLGFNPMMLITEFHFALDLLLEMIPPNFSRLWESNATGVSILQTLSMSFLGTFWGCILAFFLAFLAASNTMPFKPLRYLAGTLLAFLRVIPALVVILIFVIAVVLGPFTGALTLIISTIGTFGKLFTEAIENTESAPGEAIYSVGASRLQVIRYAILPQIIPTFIANFLYSFDINMRAAVALGIFGAGGIGFELHMAMQVLHYKDAVALILFIILLITLVEKVSDHYR